MLQFPIPQKLVLLESKNVKKIYTLKQQYKNKRPKTGMKGLLLLHDIMLQPTSQN